MAVEFGIRQIVLSGVVGVEEAETMLSWLQQTEHVKVDMSELEHLHSANIQVLAAAKVHISAWPQETQLSKFLQSILAGNCQ